MHDAMVVILENLSPDVHHRLQAHETSTVIFHDFDIEHTNGAFHALRNDIEMESQFLFPFHHIFSQMPDIPTALFA